MTETTFVKDEELEEQEATDEMENEDPIDEQFPIQSDHKPEDNKPKEPEKKGPVKRFFGWIGDKFNKARKNPVVVGVASFAAGVGVTLGAEALANHFGKGTDADTIETEFSDPVELAEPEEDFVPDEVVEETSEEPTEAVVTEV